MTDETTEAGTPPVPVPEHVAVYLRIRTASGGRPLRRRRRQIDPDDSVPFGGGRDPHGIGSVVDALTADLGWREPLAKSDLLRSWEEIVGRELAAHCVPLDVTDDVLTVRCDSTAWATQLRLMRGVLLTALAERFPEAGVQSVRLQGPDVPNWKKGPRSIPGRGPRDTYG